MGLKRRKTTAIIPVDQTTIITTVTEKTAATPPRQITKTMKNLHTLSIPFVKPWGKLAQEHPGPGHISTTKDHKALLFTPLRLRDVTLKNRIVVAPMYTVLIHYGYRQALL